ncbi:MAG: hypothetical protein ACE5ES_02060 [Candidatus Nanoarchaeia archaeon]
MPPQDTSQIKEKIILTLRRRGPSLPVHIAKEIEISPLFTSAFLSEMLAEKRLRMTNMRVGNSAVYFLSGQEPTLERFSQHLKSREKDAYELLKEKKFLKDIEQEPAIRVALRAIKDFAKPFKKNDEIYWRYYTISESELEVKEKPKELIQKQEITTKQKDLDIFNRTPKKTSTKKQTKKVQTKASEKFFNKIREFLSKNSIELLDIESFSKNEILLRVKNNNQEQLLVAYNKKRINELDILKAHKKASELNLRYILVSLGEPLKKLDNLIESIRNLSAIGKIE